MTNTNETRNILDMYADISGSFHTTPEGIVEGLVTIEKACSRETENKSALGALVNARRLAGIMQVAVMMVFHPRWNKAESNKFRELLRTNGLGAGIVKRYTEVPGKLIKRKRDLVDMIKAHHNSDPVRYALDWCAENGIKSQADILRIVEPKKAKSKAEAVADMMEKQDWTAEDHAELATILEARAVARLKAAEKTEKVKAHAEAQKKARRAGQKETTVKSENVAA